MHLTPERATPLADAVGRAGRDAGQLRPRRPGDRRDADLRGRRQLQGAARELQRVLPLRPGAPRAVAGWCRRSRAAAADLDWEDGIPHREGAWTFTTTGTTHPGAAARSRPRHERTRHKGDLVYPNLMLSASADHVAAFVLLPAGGRPDRRGLLAALRPRTRRPPTASTPATPRSSGTWSTGRTGRSASRCSAACPRAATAHGWFAPMEDDSLDIRRWLLPLLEEPHEHRDDEHVDYVVDRARRPGQRDRLELARAATAVVGLERFELGHSRGASHDTSRILRHSYHTPDVRPAHPGGVRRLGAARARRRDQPRHRRRRARPVPAGRRRSARSTTPSRSTRSASTTRCSTPPP